MRQEFQTAEVRRAFDIFLQKLNAARFEPLGLMFEKNSYLVRLYVEIMWNDDDQLEFVVSKDGIAQQGLESSRSDEKTVDEDVFRADIINILIGSDGRLDPHFSELIPDIIRVIAETYVLPEDLRIYLGAQILTEYEGDNPYFAYTTAELLKTTEATSAGQSGVNDFDTRWELVADLLANLQHNGLNCQIGSEEPNHVIVLDELAQQGIDLTDNHQCYIFVMGMCNLVENLWHIHQAGRLPMDELVNAVSSLRHMLAILRPFLPQDQFARFLK